MYTTAWCWPQKHPNQTKQTTPTIHHPPSPMGHGPSSALRPIHPQTLRVPHPALTVAPLCGRGTAQTKAKKARQQNTPTSENQQHQASGVPRQTRGASGSYRRVPHHLRAARTRDQTKPSPNPQPPQQQTTHQLSPPRPRTSLRYRRQSPPPLTPCIGHAMPRHASHARAKENMALPILPHDRLLHVSVRKPALVTTNVRGPVCSLPWRAPCPVN